MKSRIIRLLGSVVVLIVTIVGILSSTQGRGAETPSAATTRAGTAIAGGVRTTTVATATATTRPPTAQAGTGQRPTPTATTAAYLRPTFTPTAAPRGQPTTVANDERLPRVQFADLPQQAQETIRLIDRGGPFPYDRDGITFGNRERLLPIRADGYYREYTVITPGSSDRGARRIVAGRGGELYYTDDHYESFRRVVR